ncbi:hypothetical protein R2R32_01945 [Clostridium perfringens]|nr:hypothetical protein [Clostridium perfringens]
MVSVVAEPDSKYGTEVFDEYVISKEFENVQEVMTSQIRAERKVKIRETVLLQSFK